MKTISDYTICCTPQQTMRALELGAPIEEDCRYNKDIMFGEECVVCERQLVPPTAEQMIGWLESQGIYIIVPIPLIKDFNKKDFSKADAFEYRVVIDGSEVYCGAYLSRQESTIAAIDDALGYLEKQENTI